MRAMPYVALAFVAVMLPGCSSSPDLPDRASPAVKVEEARLATVLGDDVSIVGGPGVCKVRLLGQQGGAAFVWAECTATETPHSAASLPLRVDGTKVRLPADGAGFSFSVRQMFPADLADFVLDNPDSVDLRP